MYYNFEQGYIRVPNEHYNRKVSLIVTLNKHFTSIRERGIEL